MNSSSFATKDSPNLVDAEKLSRAKPMLFLHIPKTGGSSFLTVPVGLSLGRRVDPKDSQISIVPYVQPTGLFVAGNGTSDFVFDLGLGADFRLTKRFDARISAGLGDFEGVSLSAVWVH